jgi:hypothetical protein
VERQVSQYIVSLRQTLKYYVEAESEEEAVQTVVFDMDPADAFATETCSDIALVEEVETDPAHVN